MAARSDIRDSASSGEPTRSPGAPEVLVVIGVGGMGQAIARRIGSGRTVLLADFDGDTLATTAEGLRDIGFDVVDRVVDVGDVDSVKALAETAAGLGRVTHIAHTAGLHATQAPSEAVLRVNLLGVAIMCDVFADVVAPGGAGVVISSMAAYMAGGMWADLEPALATTPTADLLDLPGLAPDQFTFPGAAYTLAKRANILRVRAASAAWGRKGARINSISPGIISTAMGRRELNGETGAQMRKLIDSSAAKRLGTPDDIAAATAFLLDPQAAAFISGIDLLVDGGTVAGQ